MKLDVGAVADLDLEVQGYYEPPRQGNRPNPRYLIFHARARTVRPVVDPMGNLVRRERIVGAWVDLPITLLTADQIRNLELQAVKALAKAET